MMGLDRIPEKMQADQARVHELTRWLRAVSPEAVMAKGARLLARGTSEDDLWAAAALTACRHVNNQAHNLLGFVSHAMLGAEDARRLAHGQARRTRRLLLLQTLYQTVADLHDPCFAPYELLPYWPHSERDTVDAVRMLRADIRIGEYMRADHRFVGLAQTMPRAALVDLLLDIGLEGMVTDDHTLISPVLSLGMLELIGWKEGFDFLRWPIRYSASFPIHFEPYYRCGELCARYGMERGANATGMQRERAAALGALFFAAQPAMRPELAARALAHEGCSPETVIAAAAQAACEMYLRVDPVPHGDSEAVSREVAPIHIGNGLRLLRAGLAYMSPGTQARAALLAGYLLERGPSILSADFRFVPFEAARRYPYDEDMALLTDESPADQLGSLRSAMAAHDCRATTAVVRAYARNGGRRSA